MKPILMVALCLPAVAPALANAEEAAWPRWLAEQAFDRARNEKHRETFEVEWPSGVSEVPSSGEVYFISGYFDYMHVRIAWNPSGVVGLRLETRRTWYSHQGESFESHSFEVDRAAFDLVWRAAALVVAAKLERKLEEATESVWIRFGFVSHAPTYWIRLGGGSDHATFERSYNSGHAATQDDMPLFEDLQTRAIFRLFSDLVPDEAHRTQAPIEQWAPSLMAEVPKLTERVADPDYRGGLLLATTIRSLGEAGPAGAIGALRSLQSKIPTTGERAFAFHAVNEDLARSLQRLQLRHKWSPSSAAWFIHDVPRLGTPDKDQLTWLRSRFFERDPDAYLMHLLADLRDKDAEPAVLREAVAELHSRFPERGGEYVAALLKHRDPELVVDVALSLLEQAPDHVSALAALERIASDPSLPIPNIASYPQQFGRGRAVTHLMWRAPAANRWSPERVLMQLEAPGEDARVIRVLIQTLDRENLALSDEAKRKAYRRTLEGEAGCGMPVACAELAKLGDRVCREDRADTLKAVKPTCDRYDLMKARLREKFPDLDILKTE